MRQHAPWLRQVEHHAIQLGVDQARVDVALAHEKIARGPARKRVHVRQRQLDEIGADFITDHLATVAHRA